jgi:anti-sigma-K factor RskA
MSPAYNLPVAKAEPTIAREDESPPLDPGAVERAYRFHRARRAARARRHRERRWAGLRFWLVLALVLAAAALLAARTLGEIERVFGL